MRAYTITITPRDEPGGAAVVTVEIDNSAPRITRFELVATPGASLTTSQLRAIDLEMMLMGVLSSTDIVDQQPGAAAAKPAASQGNAAARTAAMQRLQRTTAKASTSKRTATEVPQSRQTARTYRRMPDDFVEVFTRDPRAAALVGHYDVPTHTAIGWIRTARRQGIIPTAQRRSR